MQLSDRPDQLSIPFANSGTRTAIPVPSQIGITAGAASLTDGFPPLTRTPIAAGGVPPSGADMNGILYEMSAVDRWANAGGGYPYDSTYATDIGGYPKGARVLRTDGIGYWLNTADNNTTDPEAGGAGWVPDLMPGATPVTMTGSNVTLTPLQYGQPVIRITGLLTGDLNLIFPTIPAIWTVINATTGAFTITAKTASGTGVTVTGAQTVVGDGIDILAIVPTVTSVSQIQTLTAEVAANALTVTFGGGALDFRNPTLANGTPVAAVSVPSNAITVPSGATLGTVSGQASRLVLLEAYNAGAPVLCVVNLAGGVQLDETNLISPTTISGASNSDNVIYSASAVAANSPYRVVGFIDITEATAGTWASDATVEQGIGGQALAALSGFGFGQTIQNVTGSRSTGVTYYNTTGKLIKVFLHATIAAGSAPAMVIDGESILLGATVGAAYTTGVTWDIPPGVSYQLSATGVTGIIAWRELR